MSYSRCSIRAIWEGLAFVRLDGHCSELLHMLDMMPKRSGFGWPHHRDIWQG